MKNKKGLVIPCAVILCLAVVIALFNIPGTRFSGYEPESLEELYSARGSLPEDVPDDAQGLRLYLRRIPGHKLSMCAFTLPEDEYDGFIESITPEESKWTGMKVKDCHSDYELDDFPADLPFRKVTDSDISEMTIVRYSPKNTGSRTNGIITDSSTHEIVYYHFVSF